jgi:hypothetical protein
MSSDVEHAGEEQLQDVAHAIEDALSFEEGVREDRKSTVEEDEIGDRAGRLAPAVQGHAELGFLERQHVDPAADHRHVVSPLAQGPNQIRLLLGRDPAEDRCLLRDASELGRVQLGQVESGHGRPSRRDSGLARDRRHGVRVVAGDDLQLELSPGEARECVRHVRPDRIGEADEPERGQLVGDARLSDGVVKKWLGQRGREEHHAEASPCQCVHLAG